MNKQIFFFSIALLASQVSAMHQQQLAVQDQPTDETSKNDALEKRFLEKIKATTVDLEYAEETFRLMTLIEERRSLWNNSGELNEDTDSLYQLFSEMSKNKRRYEITMQSPIFKRFFCHLVSSEKMLVF